jgi:micrococcal nuclease
MVQVAACNNGCSWYKLNKGKWIAAFLVGTQAPPPPPECSSAYPTVCIPPISQVGDLDCADVPQYAYFEVLPPDPHGFDGDGDGWGCESN